MVEWRDGNWQGTAEKLEEKPGPSSLTSPLWLSLDVTWSWSQFSAVISQNLTACAAAQSTNSYEAETVPKLQRPNKQCINTKL